MWRSGWLTLQTFSLWTTRKTMRLSQLRRGNATRIFGGHETFVFQMSSAKNSAKSHKRRQHASATTGIVVMNNPVNEAANCLARWLSASRARPSATNGPASTRTLLGQICTQIIFVAGGQVSRPQVRRVAADEVGNSLRQSLRFWGGARLRTRFGARWLYWIKITHD